MGHPEEKLISILQRAGVDLVCSLPCERIKNLLELLCENFFHVPLTREEEGVGICAGAALAGKRPAMFVQSSGIGNMINALLSLTAFYELPLAVFVSQRGVYKEKIQAQLPMGVRLPHILKGARIPYSLINKADDLKGIGKKLPAIYKNNSIHAFLLNPAVWEGTCTGETRSLYQDSRFPLEKAFRRRLSSKALRPSLTRFEILSAIAPFLDSRVVVCNLGFPSKELYHIKHQPSAFYMLGSMGMATPIGLGISLTSSKEVIVIDGDGSLLMNSGALATVSHFSPGNLTIFAIDNGSYGSTGDQPTFTRSCVDLEAVAKGFGIRNTFKAAKRAELLSIMKNPGKGPRFIHALAVPGNRDVPNIPIDRLAIKQQVQEFLRL